MNSLKVILAAAAIAVLASPVVAQQSDSRTLAQGQADTPHVKRHKHPARHVRRGPPLNEPSYKDCVHVAFPECTSGGRTLTPGKP
jgi:hypothetical protein